MSIHKLKHVKAVIYCFAKTCGSVFTPRKIEASYEHLYPADDNCAKLALEGPAYTKTGIFEEEQEKEYVRYLMLSEDGKILIKKAAETGIISYEYAKVRPKVTVSICQDIFDFLRSKEDKPKWQWRQRNKKNPLVFTKAKKKRVTQKVMYNLIDKYVISKKPKPKRNGAGTHTRNEEEGY